MLQNYSYLPYITVPTRITDNSSSIVEHIFSNLISNVKSEVLTAEITDHFATFVVCWTVELNVMLLRNSDIVRL